MKRLSLLVGIVGPLTITAASAQSVDLTGVQMDSDVSWRRAGLRHPERVGVQSPDRGWRTFPCLAGLVLACQPHLDRHLQYQRGVFIRRHVNPVRQWDHLAKIRATSAATSPARLSRGQYLGSPRLRRAEWRGISVARRVSISAMQVWTRFGEQSPF